jgi:Na+/melibiose symporter-like transporter
MLRLSLFASRQFNAINVVTVLIYGGLSASAYLLALQCQLQLGYSATQAGAALVPSTLVVLAISPLSGALVARIGPRRPMVVGIVLVAASQLGLATVGPGASYVPAILPAALVHGLGLGLMVTPLTAAVLAAVDDGDLGEASAINDASARVGALVAIGLLPVLLGAGGGTDLAGALDGGYGHAMIAIALVSVAAAVATAILVSDRPTTVHDSRRPRPITAASCRRSGPR